MTAENTISLPVRTGDVVRLAVPTRPEYLSFVRLMAASLASQADLDIEDVDDLRIAADELSHLLMENHPGGVLELAASVAPGFVVLDGSVPANGTEHPTVSDLVEGILRTVVDSYRLYVEDGAVRFRLTKSTEGGA